MTNTAPVCKLRSPIRKLQGGAGPPAAGRVMATETVVDTTAEIRFDNWTLRGQPRELLHDGVRVRLQEQPLQILDELLAHPGQVVAREQLIALLWPKRIVDYDSALNAAVRRLPAALG